MCVSPGMIPVLSVLLWLTEIYSGTRVIEYAVVLGMVPGLSVLLWCTGILQHQGDRVCCNPGMIPGLSVLLWRTGIL